MIERKLLMCDSTEHIGVAALVVFFTCPLQPTSNLREVIDVQQKSLLRAEAAVFSNEFGS